MYKPNNGSKINRLRETNACVNAFETALHDSECNDIIYTNYKTYLNQVDSCEPKIPQFLKKSQAFSIMLIVPVSSEIIASFFKQVDPHTISFCFSLFLEITLILRSITSYVDFEAMSDTQTNLLLNFGSILKSSNVALTDVLAFLLMVKSI